MHAFNPRSVRLARHDEIEPLARLWYDGWEDAHAEILPPELANLRTLESFHERLSAVLADAPDLVRVVGPPGFPLGLCWVRDDELYQLYVAAEARGTGVAAALISDAEARFSRTGVETAWLACAIGNDRAARFYEKRGWHRVGVVTVSLETPDGAFPLDVWRYEKTIEASVPGDEFEDTPGDSDDASDDAFDDAEDAPDDAALVSCPYCGAEVELLLDPAGGAVQGYVEDCEVCCRPWQVTARWDASGAVFVEAMTDDA